MNKRLIMTGAAVGAAAGYFFWKQHEAGEKRKHKDKANADFHAKYGPWAIITGAARRQGLGFGFARHLAARHFNLILVDARGEELEARAEELRRHYHVKVKPVTLDLGQTDFLPQLQAATEGLSIGLLICNHMTTPADTPKFLEMELETLNAMLDVNARAYTTLLHSYGRQMAAQGRGGLIVIASQAALHGTPYTGAYAANKAYQLILGESLWYELQNTNVDVLVVAPGLTKSQEEALAGYPEILLTEVDPTISETLNNLGQRHLVIPGLVNKLLYFATTHLLSRQQTVEQTGQLMASSMGKN